MVSRISMKEKFLCVVSIHFPNFLRAGNGNKKTTQRQFFVSLSYTSMRQFKCYCQKKPGNSKRSRSAVYLHVFTVWKLSEKINNHGIWRSSRSIFFEISLFRDFGTSGDLKKHEFWLTLGEVKTYLAKLPIVLIFFP